MEKLTGRIAEQQILAGKMASGTAELIAIYGRRRVGKTFLILTYCKDALVFELTGIYNAGFRDQLENFSRSLQKAQKNNADISVPRNWLAAFDLLDRYIDSLPPAKAAVIFFDEFPWLHSQKSRFLQAFDHWWNVSASLRPHIKVVICGSAASWMIDQVINDMGGLHNRVTQRIRLEPFTLGETEEYLNSRSCKLDHYQILQLYMAMGGIPQYLKSINPGESAAQVIDRLCFTRDGLLKSEFNDLYRSLFTHSENHEAVVRALSKNGKGLTRNEIIKLCKFTSGGTTSKILKELTESGFITPYIPFQKTVNDSIYKLSDEYSLFYIKFIEGAKASGAGTWLRQFGTSPYTSWSRFAFESICQKHSQQIKKALGIEGVLTEVSTWRYHPLKGGNRKGAQIDLLLDRADRSINLCEMKFSTSGFVINKKYAGELDNKENIFRMETKTRKTLFLTLITTYGIFKNEYSLGRVQAEVVMEDLFST